MSAVSTQWPHKKPILVDPSKKKGIVIFLAILTVFIVYVFKGYDIIEYYVASHNRDVLRPQMAKLAEQGKPDAVAWMVLNDRAFRSDANYKVLKAAAETGSPQSMFLYSYVLKYQKNDQDADYYLARAAAEGYPDAVLALSKDALK